MKKFGLTYLSLVSVFFVNGQTLSIQAGTSISKLNWDIPIMAEPLYNEKLIGYSVFAGIDYLDKKHFNLSSHLGFIRRGGQQESEYYSLDGIAQGRSSIDKARLDYLSLNTMVDLKWIFNEKFGIFISAGPRLDLLIDYSASFDLLDEIDALKKQTYGLLVGAGFKYFLPKMEIGIRVDSYLDFSKIAEWSYDENAPISSVIANTYSISLSVGYKLNQ